MKNINLQNPVELEAKGNLNSKHCKPVLCIETGTIYTSATDAANAMGVNPSAISLVCIGKMKTCKGNHFCYLSKITENISAIAVQLKEVETLRADANAYREQKAREEAARIAEKKRIEAERKAEEKRREEISKAEARLVRCQTILQRKEEEVEHARQLVAEAQHELNILIGNANANQEEEMWHA